MKKLFKLTPVFLSLALAACSSAAPTSTAPAVASDSTPASQASSAPALNYPTKPIEMIVGFSAGGGTHLAAELLSPDAQKYLGQPLNIVCKPGAGGAIGATSVANAKPDGYTLLYATFALPASLGLGDAEFAPEELVGIAQCSSIAPVIAVKADAPYSTAQELTDWVKANPGKFTWTFPGIGSSLHICGANALYAMGIYDDVIPVPYDGTAEGVAAVLGGHVNAISCFPTSLTEQIKAGEIKVIGLQATDRSDMFPEFPTFKEQGFDATTTSWRGVFAPAKTPPEILEYLDAKFAELIASDTYYDRAMTLGEGRAYLNAADFTDLYIKDCEVVKPLLEKLELIN